MGSLRESGVRVKSASQTERGEGVFIGPPQKLAVTEDLCAYQNFRPRVGTFDQFKKQTTESGLSETTQDLRERVSELPTLDFYLAEDPLSDGARHFRWGSELLTQGRNFRPLVKFSDLVPVCASCREMDGWFLF